MSRSGRFRGWGGAAVMAVACAVTASLTLLPLSLSGEHPDADGGPALGGPGMATVTPAAAADCDEDQPDESLTASPADGTTIQAIKNRVGGSRKLVVGVDQNSYRWGYRNPATGDLEGFDIDLAKAIAEEILGSPDDIIFRAIPTNQRIPALQDGRVDLIVRTMTITCERKKDVDFSTAYFQTGQQVLAPENSSISGYDSSLEGKRVCRADGSTAEAKLSEQDYGSKPVRVANQLDCLVRLQLGQADAVVTDSALAAGQAAQDPSVVLKGEEFTREYYGVAVKLGSDDLVRRVNKVLEDYRQGAWSTAYEKWLEADMGRNPGPPNANYRED
jgi:polar amino acid transport system substrate-binding protein